MDIQPDLSVCVIPAPDAAGTVDCVESLLANNDPVGLEILLPTGCGLESYFDTYPEVHFVDFPYGNVGENVFHVWHGVRGRYLAVFHSSITAGAGSLLAMLEFLDDHPDVGAAAPRLFSSDQTIQANCFQNRLMPFASLKKMPGWDGMSSVEIDWMSPDVLFVNQMAFLDCSVKDFVGKIWSKTFCTRLCKKGWHQFFVHYSKGMCLTRLQCEL